MAEEQKPEMEKESRDPLIARLSKLIENDLGGKTESFCIQGEGLQTDEISAHNGLFSLFMFKAAQVYMETMNKRAPLYFEHDKSALIEVVPMTEDHPDNSVAMWSHFVHFAVEHVVKAYSGQNRGLRVNDMIPLDALYEEWYGAIQKNDYAVRPSTRGVSPVKAGGA